MSGFSRFIQKTRFMKNIWLFSSAAIGYNSLIAGGAKSWKNGYSDIRDLISLNESLSLLSSWNRRNRKLVIWAITKLKALLGTTWSDSLRKLRRSSLETELNDVQFLSNRSKELTIWMNAGLQRLERSLPLYAQHRVADASGCWGTSRARLYRLA